MMWGAGGCCGGLWGWLWMIFLLILFLAAVYVLIRAFGGIPGGGTSAHTPSTPREDPLTILKARYARGEISREEFERTKQDLEKT